MTEKKKIKVVWVCHLSNEEIRKRLHFRKMTLRKVGMVDFAKWNTNAINEFKKFDDIELHIISPHLNLSSKIQEFTLEGIHYYFFRSEDDNLLFRIKRKLMKGKYLTPGYERNTGTILSIIDSIKPDLIHIIGAENPYYSKSALTMPKNIPVLVALQTLMIDPDFYKNYSNTKQIYKYRSDIEREVLQRADYITFRAKRFGEILCQEFNPAPKMLDMPLAVGEDIAIGDYKKQYDFVYFAANISKAADWAIEAFAMAQKKHPGITLNISGGYNQDFKETLDKRIAELGITENVIFSGSQKSHNDVLNQIRKSRFALLPLKIDLIAGTIREAMANGLPVVTTITPATPKLNEKRESVLLSEKGDFDAMAENMCRLLSSTELAKTLQENGTITMREKYSNESSIKLWRENYYAVLKEYNKKIQ